MNIGHIGLVHRMIWDGSLLIISNNIIAMSPWHHDHHDPGTRGWGRVRGTCWSASSFWCTRHRSCATHSRDPAVSRRELPSGDEAFSGKNVGTHHIFTMKYGIVSFSVIFLEISSYFSQWRTLLQTWFSPVKSKCSRSTLAKFHEWRPFDCRPIPWIWHV